MTLYGADGCAGGWMVVAEASDGSLRSEWHMDIGTLIKHLGPNDVLAIDSPIGLTLTGPREADTLSRQMLKQRGCCVFPAPVRPALRAKSRAEADAIRRSVEGKGVPAQAFGIYAMIDNLDACLRANPSTAERVYEIHPEISYAHWLGQPLPSKKSASGREARQSLCEAFFGKQQVEELMAGTKSKYHEDLFDAMAALWSAKRILRGVHSSFPAVPPIDSEGMRMAIHF